jgi:hypothetical protein
MGIEHLFERWSICQVLSDKRQRLTFDTAIIPNDRRQGERNKKGNEARKSKRAPPAPSPRPLEMEPVGTHPHCGHEPVRHRQAGAHLGARCLATLGASLARPRRARSRRQCTPTRWHWDAGARPAPNETRIAIPAASSIARPYVRFDRASAAYA